MNRKQEVRKDKTCYDIHKGPAGSRPRSKNYFPVMVRCWIEAKAFTERMTSVSVMIKLRPLRYRLTQGTGMTSLR